ncbi:heparinase II/III family protein [Cohnella cholangitidis]|nr:alginate lyase family protein [Cohnella cholangitidis]
MIQKVKKIFSKPIGVVWYRVKQELQLSMMDKFSRWEKVQATVDGYWNTENIDKWVSQFKPSIIAADFEEGLEAAIKAKPNIGESVESYASKVFANNFEILGSTTPTKGINWNEDWRYQYCWPNKYFKLYNFYEKNKKVPYDVKYPWEASRMNHLIPALVSAILYDRDDQKKWVVDVIANWQEENPLAYSVNWYPMECSMRMINLIILLEMMLVSNKYDSSDLMIIIKLLCSHGEFLYRTIEYTDIRGNHYTANIVALLLTGFVLEHHYPRSQVWLKYARDKIDREILLQYTDDGVNHEKSIPYHRLVTELFVIALIASERHGYSIDPVAKDRIIQACNYTKKYSRPDGKVPIVGDNDSARAFNFDLAESYDHSTLLSIASVLFNKQELLPDHNDMDITVPILFGTQGLKRWNVLNAERQQVDVSHYFAGGGVVIIKDSSNFLWIDVGEVGMNNRGGHGHNDLFSFELMFDRQLLILDPGCPVYTGDPMQKNYFRGTSSHNNLMIDNEEIAPLVGMWGYANSPLPEVDINIEKEIKIIKGSHSGYTRLTDPVSVSRKFEYNPKEKSLRCTDIINCQSMHITTRSLHLAPEIIVNAYRNTVNLMLETKIVCRLTTESTSEIRIEDGWYSPGYGSKVKTKIIRIINRIEGETELSFDLISVKRGMEE